jgi:hypothetical protein
MIQFYIVIEGDGDDYLLVKHIQYNLAMRIRKLKYYKYRRFELILNPLKSGIDIVLNDFKTAYIIAELPPNLLNGDNPDNVRDLYSLILGYLDEVWKNNNWDSDDLSNIFNDIREQNFQCISPYGKVISSPDKKLKASFSCEITPRFTNYSLEIHDRKKQLVNKFLFLKGQQDLIIFFLFFSSYYWVDNENFVLSNRSKEIFFVYNMQHGVTLEYRPSANSLEECQNYVDAFRFDITTKERNKKLQPYYEKSYDGLI